MNPNASPSRIARAARRFRFLLWAPLGLVAGCYGSDFTQTTTEYDVTTRPPDAVRVTSEHPGPGYAEVGLLTGTGGSFEGAIKRIKEEAGERGCDVVYVQGEAIQSGYGTPGAAYGMTKSHVRAACFVAIPGARDKPIARTTAVTAQAAPAPVTAAAAPAACVPDCRQGFDCVQGRCVSSCNPACPDGETCLGHGGAATCAPPAAK